MPDARRPSEIVTVLGLNASRLGVGQGARLLCDELRASGIDVRVKDATTLISAPREGTAAADDDDRDGDGDWPIIIALNPDVAVHALADMKRDFLRNRRVIGFWVWELPKLARAWELARHWVHEIWTPSHYSAGALRALDVPVIVTPHPVALAPAPQMPDAAEARRALGVDDKTFVAINSFSLSSSLTRKNPIGAMQAFSKAFPDGDAVLILRALEKDRYPDAWRVLSAEAARCGPSVRLMSDPGPLAKLHQLYAAADVYLSLHRSEGFGLNLAEAMLAGVPVMATAHSAPLEFLDDACAALVPARDIPARDAFGPYDLPSAVWADPDIDKAAAILRALAHDPARRSAMAQRAHARALTMTGGAAARALRMEASW